SAASGWRKAPLYSRSLSILRPAPYIADHILRQTGCVVMDQAKAPADSSLLATWPRCVQVTVAVLLALGIGYVLVRGVTGYAPARAPDDMPEVAEPVRARLDLNRASRAELALIPGLGPSRAQGIDDYRRAHGAFASVDDLRKVSGIGPKTLEKVRPWLF